MDQARDLKRFESYFAKGAGCWLWTGAKIPRGYGRFYFRGKPRYAHRVSLELYRGLRAPDDKVVMHACDNPSCVNPDHLSVGTRTDNMRDAQAKGRCVRVGDWRGSKNPKHKLCAFDMMVIEIAIRCGEDRKTIAKNAGVTTARIGQIARAMRDTKEL